MYKMRYVQQKRPPELLTPDDRIRLATERVHLPSFGQSPSHPQQTPARISLEYADRYRGDRK
jgi:hypothetical protein